jgi:hypothetical protein
MNVKEIGESTSVWAFVIIACALSVGSGLGWVLWRAPWKTWGNRLRWELKIPVSQKERKKHDMELSAQYV